MKQPNVEMLEEVTYPKHYLFAKRMLDIILSGTLLVLLSPLLLLVSCLLYIDAGFPVIFEQTRVGTRGKPFILKKFRTMPQVKPTSSKERKEYRKNWIDGVPDNFVFKSSSPVEVSKLGTFLRKYSLDELPQLINILKGEMSLVGPRPEISEITDYYNMKQRQRLLVKPGLTGYAQVNGRSGLTHGEKIQCDLYYVKHMSLMLDVRIIFQTVKHVIKPENSF